MEDNGLANAIGLMSATSSANSVSTIIGNTSAIDETVDRAARAAYDRPTLPFAPGQRIEKALDVGYAHERTASNLEGGNFLIEEFIKLASADTGRAAPFGTDSEGGDIVHI